MASYNNRSLFSDYYLEELIGEDSHWQAFKSKAWEFHQRITNILEKAVPGINGDTPEAEVERRLIRPILDVLGHLYFVQPAVHSPEGIRRPDYAFFSSPEVRQEAESHKGQPEFFRNALAIGDAKAWERSLDKRVKGAGDPFTNHNPSYQIDFYLRATDKRWGLLTNGRHWRVYHRDLSYRLDVYYEVDLPQIITLDENAFLYFLAFFHKEAFQTDGTGVCFLDRAYRASTEYTAKVSEELKENVYEALRLLAEGLLSFPGNNLKPENLDLVRENAFIVIYRLLFTLYAEAREFLPVTNPTYWGTYSLRALTHEIATKEPFESKLSPITTMYWSRLRELFGLINSGNDFLHIPPYNGRLFDDQKEHQSLAAWKIGDSYLAGAIDQLAQARAAGRTGRGFVSYRDLSIRELGSIYEGLLEHRPRYATQDMAVIKEDKREKFIPLAELGSRKALKVYTAGSVYLETDKGERKATGSYYTPGYIVKYIVGNTVGPLLEEAKNSDGNLIDSILSLKVLDPAMGSGHFLVEATDFLARALVEALGGDPREMEEDEVRWARREVVERCIYGVDLNPLAVDLAKLSLWLSTVSLDKPLNFLDHHLRCGNSLIGTRVEDIGLLPEVGKKSKLTAVTTLAGYQFKSAIASAVSIFHTITEEPSDSVEDIHRKEGAYETARYALSRIKSIADVWTSVYFGNEVKDKDAYELLLGLAGQDGAEWPGSGELPWLDKSKATAEERRFFHWELEFPEVFFDRNGQRLPTAGFSAVVGNPPYVNFANMVAVERKYYQLEYYCTRNKSDLYALFLEASLLSWLNSEGRHGFIVSSTWLSTDSFKPLRELLSQDTAEIVLVPLEMGTFKDATVEPLLLLFKKGEARDKLVHYGRFDGQTFQIVASAAYNVAIRPDNYAMAVDYYGLQSALLRHLDSVSTSCEKFISFTRGVKTADDSRFVQQQPQQSDSYKVLRGRDIQRYSIDYASLWLWYRPDLMNQRVGAVPHTEEHFLQAEKLLLQGRSGTALIATYDNEGFFALDTAYISLGSPSLLSINYILALVNSLVINYWYGSQFKTSTISGYELHKIPIRHINFTTSKAERDQMVQQSKRLYEEYLQTKDRDKVLAFVDDRLPQNADGTADTEHEQSDVVHDLLAFLAEEMTRLHKEKHTETKGFLNWLEAYLGVNIEELKNKTKIKEYYKAEGGWEDFLGALEQNRRAIQLTKGVDITRREPQQTIRAEFDPSIAKLKPILETIELTDKLIDQIVYRLYGLTEEEMAVVEGRG